MLTTEPPGRGLYILGVLFDKHVSHLVMPKTNNNVNWVYLLLCDQLLNKVYMQLSIIISVIITLTVHIFMYFMDSSRIQSYSRIPKAGLNLTVNQLITKLYRKVWHFAFFVYVKNSSIVLRNGADFLKECNIKHHPLSLNRHACVSHNLGSEMSCKGHSQHVFLLSKYFQKHKNI